MVTRTQITQRVRERYCEPRLPPAMAKALVELIDAHGLSLGRAKARSLLAARERLAAELSFFHEHKVQP